MSTKIEEKESIQFKIITLGDCGVGKKSIIKRYVYNNFVENQLTTIGISFSFKEVILKDGTKISLKFINTGGQEKYRALSKSYFKNANGVLFVFSLNDVETFNDLGEWAKQFEENNDGTNFVCKYLVGNKNDLEIKVDQTSIEDFKKDNKFDGYASISVKENDGIDKLFEDMSQILYDDYKRKGKEIEKKNILLEKTVKRKKTKCLLY